MADETTFCFQYSRKDGWWEHTENWIDNFPRTPMFTIGDPGGIHIAVHNRGKSEVNWDFMVCWWDYDNAYAIYCPTFPDMIAVVNELLPVAKAAGPLDRSDETIWLMECPRCPHKWAYIEVGQEDATGRGGPCPKCRSSDWDGTPLQVAKRAGA